MNVVRFLKENSLDKLVEEYKLETSISKDGKLVILNYGIKSPKLHPITRECRALCLEIDTWKVVARSFYRFLNLGECPDEDAQFVWNDPLFCQSKEDGSLISLYNYEGRWRINTRGSFANGIVNDSGVTWEELFYKTGINTHNFSALIPGTTYVFELCSLYNKNVTTYKNPTAYLLSAFKNECGKELPEGYLDSLSIDLNVLRPQVYKIRHADDCIDLIRNINNPTFEGFVVKDANHRRVKIKNPEYIQLHFLRNNGNVFSPKYLIPLIINRAADKDELLTHFPELSERWSEWESILNSELDNLNLLWNSVKSISSQKEFALSIIGKTKLPGILFNCRKNKTELLDEWKKNVDTIIKAFIK